MSSEVVFMLVDNGSVKPAATLMLRRLAENLSLQSKQKIHAVSLRHADRIKADELEGKAAHILKPFLTQYLKSGVSQFVLIPLFFAESSAITSFVPEQVKILEARFGHIDLAVTDVIYPLPAGESRLVNILYEHIQPLIEKKSAEKQNIVLVDHGSPSPKVTAVRQHIAGALQQRFNRFSIEQAVMERRDGEGYDFNGELLTDWLEQKAMQGEKSIIVALIFFLPGRHAGKGGDIEKICGHIKTLYPEVDIQLTPVVANHDLLTAILLERLHAVL